MSQLPIGIRNSTTNSKRGSTVKLYSLTPEDFANLKGIWYNEGDMQLPGDLDPELALPCADEFLIYDYLL